MTTWMRAGLATAAGLLLLASRPARAAEGTFGGGDPGAGCASCAASGAVGCATGTCGPRHPCPPPFCHVSEGPPCLKFKHGCPRPVCDPCKLEHFGYYPTCWSPWPYGPYWYHCPYPTASAMLPPSPVPPFTPKLYGQRSADRGSRSTDSAIQGPNRFAPKQPDTDSSLTPPTPLPAPGKMSENRPAVRLIR